MRDRQCFKAAASGKSLTGQSMCDCPYPTGPCAKEQPGLIESGDLQRALADLLDSSMTIAQRGALHDALHATTVLPPEMVKDALLAALRHRI